MRSYCPRSVAPLKNRQHGFSIAIILMAVVLMASLGAAVLLSSRSSSSGMSDTEVHDRITATILIAQARALRDGIYAMTANGIPINTITFDTSASTGLYNPTIGGATPQIPPLEALGYSGPSWVWKVNSSGNPVVKLNSVGINSNADYVIALPGVALETCHGVDVILHGYGSIYYGSLPQVSAGIASDWSTPSKAIDLSSASSGTQGWQEGCYSTSDGGDYVYIATVEAQ